MRTLRTLQLSLFAVIGFMVSCNNGIRPEMVTGVDNSMISANSIPLEIALESLRSFIDSDVSTKNDASVRRIHTIDKISVKDCATKSHGAFYNSCDTLVYLINFCDEKGFAVLAADNRISDRIIAVTDYGSLSRECLLSAFQNIELRNGQTKTLNDPITNISTFDFYNEDIGDWYIGDYYGEGGQSIQGQLGYVSSLIAGYVADELNGGITIIGGDTPENPFNYDTIETSTIETTRVVVPNLLTSFVNWEQSISPYNDGLHYDLFTAAVGCVNIAMGKVLAYLEYPENLQMYSYTIDWDAIKNAPTSFSGRSSIRYLLQKLYEDNDSIPFFDNATFTFPLSAKNTFIDYGFTNVSYQNYSTTSVTSALRNGCPVIVSSLNSFFGVIPDVLHSHAWNIDGYKEHETKTVYNYYLNGELVFTSFSEPDITTMVHCAWGWGGYCDGFFTSNVFNFDDDDSYELDSSAYSSVPSDNYSVYTKTIIYSNPNAQ